MVHMHRSNRKRDRIRRAQMVTGLVLACLFCLQAERFTGHGATLTVPTVLEAAEALPSIHAKLGPNPAFGVMDPLEYLRQCRRDYERRVRDYTCTLRKQELLNGKLSPEQVARVKFREGPFSVFMHIVENPAQVRRVLYVKDKIVKHGQEYAVVELQNALLRFLLGSVECRIESPQARRASRRLISEFGFASSLDLIIRYAERSMAQGRLDLRWCGTGEVDGRPTYVLERRLPRTENADAWPDALLVVHIDQEWRLPVACMSYADADGQDLLGKYVFTDIQLNIGLQPSDFEAERYGL